MLQKFASVKVSSIITTEQDFNKFADNAKISPQTRKIVQYNPDFVYARFKAIGCIEVDGPNANADAFPYGEFLDNRPNYGYQSFIGKHAFVEHQSNNINNSIGDLHHSYLNRFNTSELGNREWAALSSDERNMVLAKRADHEDGSIEVLMAIDKKLSPKIARMLETGSPTACSMGTNIDYSECSICGNRAYVEEKYCNHIKHSKGQYVLVSAAQIHDLIKKGSLEPEWLPWILQRPSDIQVVKTAGRKMVYARAFELNYGLSFFELSIVANPAFSRGYKLEKIASMAKPSSQLMPLIYVAKKPVEAIFKVADGYFTELFGQAEQPVQPGQVRNGELAKTALSSGNVHEVLIDKKNAPFFIKENIELTAAETPGFYKVSNPETLLDKTFAAFRSRNKIGVVGTIEETHFACPICNSVYDRKTQKKVASTNLTSFKSFSICENCEDLAVSHKGDYHMATKKAEYPTLPTTTEFTGDKEVLPGKGAFVDEKEQLYESWAENGSEQIEKEKEYRPMGTIFTDPITVKSDLNARATRINELLKSTKILQGRAKLALEDPPSFLQEMLPAPAGRGPDGRGPKLDGSGPDGKGPRPDGLGRGNCLLEEDEPFGMAIEIDMTSESAPEILENVKEDLSFILEDLQRAKELTEQREVEASNALENKIRWSRRFTQAAIKTAESVDIIIGDAENAITDAIAKLEKASDVLNDSDSIDSIDDKVDDKVDDKTDNDLFDKKSDSSKKDDEDKTAGGDDAMAKESNKLEITAGNIELLQKLRETFAGNSPFSDEDDDKKEKNDKKDEDKKDEDKKDESKKDKKENPFAKFDKEAAAMPPTGAKDPGDYGQAGAIESYEMNRWWNDMAPEFYQMKSKEQATSFNDPDGRVELLTGFVGNKSADNPEVGSQTNSPAIFAKRFISRGPKWASSFIGVVKVAEDNIPQAFTANFRDVAGDEGDEEEFNEFISDRYLDDVVATVKMHGIKSAFTQMGGKVAQLEGITPGKTEKVNPLYDTKEENKHSNTPRKGETPGAGTGNSGGDKAYYGKAYGDTGYASDLVTANQKIASLDNQIKEMQMEKRSAKLAEYALHLARVSASRGIIPFDIANIQKQAMEYIQLDEAGVKTVKAHLEKLPIVNQRALEAYQIPEAENMAKGVVHNALDVVDKVREQHVSAEDIAPDGIQQAVERDAKVSASQKERIRKQAADNNVVPQMHVGNTVISGDIPDITKHFNTIENRLRKAGTYEANKHFLRSNRIQ